MGPEAPFSRDVREGFMTACAGCKWESGKGDDSGCVIEKNCFVPCFRANVNSFPLRSDASNACAVLHNLAMCQQSTMHYLQGRVPCCCKYLSCKKCVSRKNLHLQQALSCR